jgi:type II secretory ATPase GspE/PulE/Tfp pilus assembly ATPase PilB-like protein
VAQRLVRRICPQCKIPLKPTAELSAQLKASGISLDKSELFEGKGCQDCRFTGYKGRTAIYEILSITEDIREMILQRASSQQIKQKAVSEGMRTLRVDGLEKVVRGITTLTEVIRVTQQEELPEE